MNTAALLALIGTGLMATVRLFRTQAVQSVLPEQYRWERWPALMQIAFVFGLSLAGALATSLSQGTPVTAALGAAFTAALAAMGINSATKNIGHDMTLSAVEKDLNYKPSALRDVLSIALPLNQDLLDAVSKKAPQ
jgi:hypothetical protein